MDYKVRHFNSDLKDGVRLTRLVEIITECPLTDKLRVPANSRLQKIHNVGLVLSKLQVTEQFIFLNVKAKRQTLQGL